MTASIHPFPTRLAKLETVDGLAEKIGEAVKGICPDPELAVPALCAVIFHVASNSPNADTRHGAVRALRVVASIIEESDNGGGFPGSPENIPS